MVSWVFTLDNSFAANGISVAVQNQVRSLFEAAGDIWSRCLGDSAASIEVVIRADDLGDTTLGEAGPTNIVDVGGGIFASSVTHEI